MHGPENGLLWRERPERARMAGAKAGRKDKLTSLWCQALGFAVRHGEWGLSLSDRRTTQAAIHKRIRRAET